MLYIVENAAIDYRIYVWVVAQIMSIYAILHSHSLIPSLTNVLD